MFEPMEGDTFHVQGAHVGEGGTFRQGHTYNAPVTNYRAAEPEATPKTVCDIPDFLSQHFVGRVDDLARIQDAFENSDGDSPARCILYGVPGLGKTQLALKYAESVYEGDHIPYIFWISAASPDKLVQGFSRLLDLIAFPGRQGLDQQARCVAARNWLGNESGGTDRKWLLILDNANEDTVDRLWEMLPRRNASGRVLFTTRTKPVAESLATAFQKQHSCIELSAFGRREAVELFSRASEIATGALEDAQKQGIEELVKLVGHLPLAVDQVASFIAVSGTSISTVLEIYKSEKLSDALEWENNLSRYEQKSVMDIYTFAIEQLQNGPPGLIDLLRVMLFLDPEYIPINLLKEGCSSAKSTREIETHPNNPPNEREQDSIAALRRFRKGSDDKASETDNTNEQRTEMEDPEQQPIERPGIQMTRIRTILDSQFDLHKALQYAQRLSLIQVLKQDNKTAVRMHDLTQLILRRKLLTSKEECKGWLLCTITMICNFYKEHASGGTRVEMASWSSCEQLLAHVRALQIHVQEYGANQVEFLDVCYYIGRYLEFQRREDDAARLLERTLAQARLSLGAKHLKTIIFMGEMAVLYLWQSKLEAAESLTKEAMVITYEILGREDPRTLVYTSLLGEIYSTQGRHADANNLIDDVLEVLDNMPKFENSSVTNAMRRSAKAARMGGQVERTVFLLERALKEQERLSGANHYQTAYVAEDLAYAYSGIGKLKEAETLYLCVLEIGKRTWGPEHPQMATAMHNLGRVYAKQGHWDESIDMLQRAMRVNMATLGPDHKETRESIEVLKEAVKSKEQFLRKGTIRPSQSSQQDS